MKPLSIVFWVIGAFVLIFPSLVWWFLWQQELQRVKAPNVGNVASSFNDIVSPIFAALAFAGLVYTALMQREELGLQREQSKENQVESKRQANARETSGRILSSQVDVARLSAQLSAAQALYVYYTTVIASAPSNVESSYKNARDFVISYADKVPGYDRSQMWQALASAGGINLEFVSLKTALEAQKDLAIRDMQRVQAELRRVTTAKLNVEEEAQTMQASATANIQNDGATAGVDGALVKLARRAERWLGRR